jgi:hypothetical protein
MRVKSSYFGCSLSQGTFITAILRLSLNLVPILLDAIFNDGVFYDDYFHDNLFGAKTVVVVYIVVNGFLLYGAK